MQFNSIRNISAGPQFGRKLLAVLLCCGIIALAYAVLNRAGQDARDTVDVVRIKSEGLAPKTLVTQDNIERYSLIKREYVKDMVLYADVDKVLQTYSLYYLRGGSILHFDQVTMQKPLKNAWLYELTENSEVLTVPYNYLECGGDILTPGDQIRMRISYDTGNTFMPIPGTSLPNPEAGRKTESLFDKIRVIDLLNSRGHSIYEFYYNEILRLDEKKKQEVMKSKEFLDNILPKSMVLEANPNQADAYAKFKSKKDLSFTITILSRKHNQNVLDGIPSLAGEVQSWLEQGS